jgi:hypothetical protein
MASVSYRGVVHDGIVVLREGAEPLAEGTEVLVTPVAGRPGSPAAVLEALNNAPPVPREWVDELEQLIASGRRLPSRPEPFADDNEIQGRR